MALEFASEIKGPALIHEFGIDNTGWAARHARSAAGMARRLLKERLECNTGPFHGLIEKIARLLIRQDIDFFEKPIIIIDRILTKYKKEITWNIPAASF
jgi:hypothetical protein